MHVFAMLLLGMLVAREAYRGAVKKEKRRRVEEALDLGLDEPGD